ncbi:MAG: DUF983 domain-containing protein [Cytophagaceae bacterium]|nr:DUF983 domain-containing protein [Cytophagaceae bacterium]
MKPDFVLLAMLKLKCPQCRKGDMFLYSNMYSFKKFAAMPRNCTCCGLNLMPEPGFYTGAMYISYGLNVALFTPGFIITATCNLSFTKFILLYFFLVIGASVYIFRLSRAIYLYIFIDYNPKLSNCNNK